eukprot:11157855-Lingulodinium_polyedra.AAC.1
MLRVASRCAVCDASHYVALRYVAFVCVALSRCVVALRRVESRCAACGARSLACALRCVALRSI